MPHFEPRPGGIFSLGGRRASASARSIELARILAGAGELSEPELHTVVGQGGIEELAASMAFVRLPPPLPPPPASHVEIVLSPHIDDAALSLGGAIHRWSRRRRVVVVNVFSRQSFQTGWRVPAERLPEIARLEDELAGRLLGFESQHLGLWGAADRQDLSLGQVLGHRLGAGDHDDRRQVRERLLPALEALGGGSYTLHAPLGIGGHLDHVLARQVVEEAMAAGQVDSSRVVFYQDLPYAAAQGASQQWPAPAGLRPQRKSIMATLEHKLAALRVYRTRLRQHDLEACRRHASALGLDEPCELEWVPGRVP